MKIVIPVMGLEKGGGSRYLYQLANALWDKGHSVEVVIPVGARLHWPLRSKVTWVKELSAQTIPAADFILANWWETVMPAWESGNGQVVRLSQGYEPLWVPQAELARQTYLIDAPIISMSEWHRQLILRKTGRDSTIVHGGVDAGIFRPAVKMSFFTGRPSIFYIARSLKQGYFWKGIEDFWEACAKLRADGIVFDLWVASPEEDQIEAPFPFISKTAHTDTDLALLYAQADLFVSTSYFESFSLVQLEAMACQTAVVTTDCGGTRDYARHLQNCLVVAPSDCGQLAKSMAYLLQNTKDRERIARAGRLFAENWTWDKTADKVEKVLLGLK